MNTLEKIIQAEQTAQTLKNEALLQVKKIQADHDKLVIDVKNDGVNKVNQSKKELTAAFEKNKVKLKNDFLSEKQKINEQYNQKMKVLETELRNKLIKEVVSK